ncbi:50S ribosomal protein L6 [Candidatus Profftella armatura]|uniref:Large ribosomal subunit protein uL6 n=1 Tax=Candidatus Profftella armatura TaxID=669502 RepID=S5RLC4_9PROT|nr:50S ribosomal protein L6 [Candidatus Profftella armatura]AGS06741.1 50S ribosomal protein L6 [Candidatus Profftella armatura]ALC95860.1 50S ribosomal protein L6 [Candidatus Profftella armatura]QLK13655.1 50S ribosomal protein L6 [Candidatus Profftella armatura]
MSRIGKMPIFIPPNVEVTLNSNKITLKGPLGILKQNKNNLVNIKNDSNVLYFTAINNSRIAKSMSGTMRSIINNMIIGVTKGFEKKLQLIGVGFRAKIEKNYLNLILGFSHPILYKIPFDIICETPSQTEILIKGINKQAVGHVAAEIRRYYKPEPYKGKGVRYLNEIVILKETKKK